MRLSHISDPFIRSRLASMKEVQTLDLMVSHTHKQDTRTHESEALGHELEDMSSRSTRSSATGPCSNSYHPLGHQLQHILPLGHDLEHMT